MHPILEKEKNTVATEGGAQSMPRFVFEIAAQKDPTYTYAITY
jgi:hypothetical protein